MFTTQKTKASPWLLFGFLFLIITRTNAQEGNISGKIISSKDGLVLPDANLSVKNKIIAASTDLDRSLEIIISGKTTLVFNHIGGDSKEVLLGNSNNKSVY
ncbi:hypothetical protein ACEN2I_15980 [Flavobacterium sp. W22_SRS_FK3]|uniref:hypothetical protein n=1 Tax=Flavobacterium sp. W22_SRS_FK3 TaxID=3240275 RepID=UPI003F8FDC7F